MGNLLRLQTYYDIDSKDLASGILLRKQTGAYLNIYQCFEIGRFAKQRKFFTLAISWLYLAGDIFESYEDNRKSQLDTLMTNISREFLETVFEVICSKLNLLTKKQ